MTNARSRTYDALREVCVGVVNPCLMTTATGGQCDTLLYTPLAEGIMKNKRIEDRRPCHSISFILGLAVAGGHQDRTSYIQQAYNALMFNAHPISGQKAN